MSLAKRIRDCRYAKGWGPDELAQKADISRTALYQIECGKTETPRAGTLRRIARALDVPIERLLGPEAEGDFEPLTEVAVAELFTVPTVEADLPVRPKATQSRSLPDRVTPQTSSASHTSVTSREIEMMMKFKEILASPLGEGVGRIVEESHRLLPILLTI